MGNTYDRSKQGLKDTFRSSAEDKKALDAAVNAFKTRQNSMSGNTIPVQGPRSNAEIFTSYLEKTEPGEVARRIAREKEAERKAKEAQEVPLVMTNEPSRGKFYIRPQRRP